MAELKVILKNGGNFKIYWESVSKPLCLPGQQNRSKPTERMKAADLPFLYPGYLLHQASPGCKPGISEHAPVMLFMPIYFVLGQHDVQSPSRHDSEGSTDLLRGEGSYVRQQRHAQISLNRHSRDLQPCRAQGYLLIAWPFAGTQL